MLTERMAHIIHNGPDRVVINEHGEAVPAGRAIRDYNIIPDIIFIRDDGWSLGAPAPLEVVAYGMWSDEWVGFVRRGKMVVSPIKEYGK